MLCKRCDGRGSIWYDEQTYGKCPECIGGAVSCCEVTDEPTGFVEPMVTSGKRRIETFVFTKPPPNTGYEIPYTAPVDTTTWRGALINDIVEIITGIDKLKKTDA